MSMEKLCGKKKDSNSHETASLTAKLIREESVAVSDP